MCPLEAPVLALPNVSMNPLALLLVPIMQRLSLPANGLVRPLSTGVSIRILLDPSVPMVVPLLAKHCMMIALAPVPPVF